MLSDIQAEYFLLISFLAVFANILILILIFSLLVKRFNKDHSVQAYIALLFILVALSYAVVISSGYMRFLMLEKEEYDNIASALVIFLFTPIFFLFVILGTNSVAKVQHAGLRYYLLFSYLGILPLGFSGVAIALNQEPTPFGFPQYAFEFHIHTLNTLSFGYFTNYHSESVQKLAPNTISENATVLIFNVIVGIFMFSAIVNSIWQRRKVYRSANT